MKLKPIKAAHKVMTEDDLRISMAQTLTADINIERAGDGFLFQMEKDIRIFQPVYCVCAV